jgi:hypothetical protein
MCQNLGIQNYETGLSKVCASEGLLPSWQISRSSAIKFNKERILIGLGIFQKNITCSFWQQVNFPALFLT